MNAAYWRMTIMSLLVLFGTDGITASVRADSQFGRDEVALPKTPVVVEVKPLMAAPGEAERWEAWRKGLRAERLRMRERLGYDGGAYREEAFGWVPAYYCCCFAMMCDEKFYDRAKRCYTADAFLDEGVKEFGGYDAVVLWHAYPRIGFDDRNQFDFYRDMPGGLAGLRELSRTLHGRGVRVFIDYNPWDTGTRREDKSDVEMLAEMVSAIDADGIFLDTLHEGMQELRGRLDAVRPGVVLESELTLPVERLGDHHMSWAQWFADSEAPGVLWNKWFERRHMMHQIQRWNRDHTGELHMAWMNGSGMLVWENVFGSWAGWSLRDKSILRSMLAIQRRYVTLFSGEDWTPLVSAEHEGVYASLWQGGGIRLWTLVNRSEQHVEGTLLSVPHVQGRSYFDLIAGHECGRVEGNDVSLDGSIRPRGVAAFVAGATDTLGGDFGVFLARQASIDHEADWNASSPNPQEKLRPVERTRRYKKDEIPAGMVAVPAADLRMRTQYRNRECGFYDVVGQAAQPSRDLHKLVRLERDVSLRPYAIDLTPVTNGQYARFLAQTGYSPRDKENFLKRWRNGQVPPGLEDHPVVYVDLEDARTYARWAGKRLPAEEEWQYAAQGADGRAYPWGNQWEPGRCNDGAGGGTTIATAFERGCSPFGCYDMCGNTWELTESEHSDGRTCFCILKGGSWYKAKGSDWYADGGPQPCDFAAKFLLMWPGLDRCATIGFRCVIDLAETGGGHVE
jgi:formylglycine-generating enzyme required for sulfatase activity